jgi:hypothetical protein
MDDGQWVDVLDGRQDTLREFVFGATRMCRNTERASLEKKPSTRLSQEPCFGVKVDSIFGIAAIVSLQ